ncbi:MAG: HAD-IA family hydrolase [Lactimicrobium sp.]|jgi:HAD superfamily hydrolase (TIGR01509 family)|uniref:HAD family hydrolase n=1 Tax=Lactimicrobium sp. TaxID=2563780 RepID=UPI002F35C58B
MSKDNEKKKLKKLERNTRKPAILFSFDGAVMDTEPAILATYRHVFAVHGKDILTPDNQEEIQRAPIMDVMKKYLPDEDPRKCAAEYDSYEQNHLIDLIQPMHGVRDFLIWLKKNNYKVGIVSARERSSVVELLRHTDLVTMFDVIIGSAGNLEDRTDSIQTACKLMDADTCIFITDSSHNVRAASSAGCFTIGIVSTGSRTLPMKESGADFLTKDFKEIRKLLEGEPLWLAYQVIQPEDKDKKKKKKEKKPEKKEVKETEKKAKEEKTARKVTKTKKDKKEEQSKTEENAEIVEEEDEK